MGTRRSNGEGSVFKRKVDGRWQAQITLPTGKVKCFYGKTRTEVVNKMKSALMEINQGTFLEPSKITLGQWLDKWLTDYKEQSIRPKTFEGYEYLVRTHIIPTIGDLSLKNLKTEHLQKFYNDKFANGRIDGKGGLSAKTIHNMHIVMHNALEQAVNNELIIKNVSEATTLPRGKKKDIRVLTPEEQSKFIQVALGENLGIAFLLDLVTGLRVGELLGLDWKDIDLEKGTLHVRQSLCCVKKMGLFLQEPKTMASIRIVPLIPSIIGYLAEYKKQSKYDLVFCTAEGKPIFPRNFTRTFYRILDKAGIERINLHALRHTFATRLLEANTHPKVAQNLLGHTNVNVTMDTYSHILPQVKIEAIHKLDNLLT